MAEEHNARVTFKGNPVNLAGSEIKPGDKAPDFTAVDTNLQAVRLNDAKGKVIILSSVPSVDTPVCDTETRRFNKEASSLDEDVEVWTISMDLPFAQKRWCAAAGIDRVKVVSDFRDRSFGPAYGVQIADGPLAGVNARAVFVVGRDGTVRYVEYVGEIASEPDYDAALGAAREAAKA
jgi:thiol peroxidase